VKAVTSFVAWTEQLIATVQAVLW